jgi:molybdate transport system substrate-binding protein
MSSLFRSFAVLLPYWLYAAPVRAETVRVFAASSLTESFQEIGVLFREISPGDDVEFQFAGSQVLRVQIEEGAPADVLASADRVHMDALEATGHAREAVLFARNRLVVVTPARSPRVGRLADLPRPGVRLVVADANVPVGRYTTQVLGKMKRAGVYGDDFQRRVLANVVSRETSVRAVLAKVTLDEVDGGFVYATDARTVSEKIRTLDIPDRVNVVAEYPIAVLTKSTAPGPAARFVELVRGPEGEAVLAGRGFETVR